MMAGAVVVGNGRRRCREEQEEEEASSAGQRARLMGGRPPFWLWLWLMLLRPIKEEAEADEGSRAGLPSVLMLRSRASSSRLVLLRERFMFACASRGWGVEVE